MTGPDGALCPVCGGSGALHFRHDRQGRTFFLCPRCSLIYQDRGSLPASADEKARYDLHRNSGEDEGYVLWLKSFISEGIRPWSVPGRLLDFGSGPEPVLARLLEEEGMDVRIYDPFYAPRQPAEKDFSVIVMSEVLEHLSDPAEEFRRLRGITATPARIILKTAFVRDLSAGWFKSWWYKEDPTHIRFYTASSLAELGRRSGWTLMYQDGRSLAVYKKTAALQ